MILKEKIDMTPNLRLVKDNKRTLRQNDSLHLFFQMLADELNGAGLDMRKTLKPEIEIPWTKENVKTYLWKPVQDIYLKKKSTTELTTDQVSEVWEILNRHLGEKFGIYVPFPSIELLELKDLTK